MLKTSGLKILPIALTLLCSPCASSIAARVFVPFGDRVGARPRFRPHLRGELGQDLRVSLRGQQPLGRKESATELGGFMAVKGTNQ